MLKNSYLCLLNNTQPATINKETMVVICWKIRIFAYWTTPDFDPQRNSKWLWFAEKFVSLLIEQHLDSTWKPWRTCCDLLKNSYLCLLNNTSEGERLPNHSVVICWKIRIFAYWTTPKKDMERILSRLWFAEKFVSLLIEQHPLRRRVPIKRVVICWKIRIFAYWTTPPLQNGWQGTRLWFAEKFVSLLIEQHLSSFFKLPPMSCDLLKNSYLCLLNNTHKRKSCRGKRLWFAEKFVSLLIEQHQLTKKRKQPKSCDLLKNSYLCLLNNTSNPQEIHAT